MTPRIQTLSLLVLGLFAVATVTSKAEQKAEHKADKPGAPIVMEPFQTTLTIAMSITIPPLVGEGEASFTVPAGRRLNLRYVGARSIYVPANGGPTQIEYPQPSTAEIETSVGGVRVTHIVTGGSVALWGDDSAPITVRVREYTAAYSSVTVQYAISGDLY